MVADIEELDEMDASEIHANEKCVLQGATAEAAPHSTD